MTTDRDALGADVDASIVVPVNAGGDLQTVNALLADLSGYRGPHTVETILVVNNFPPGNPPAAVADFRARGLRVEAVPSVLAEGYAPALRARMIGLRTARSDVVITFDADCRIPSPTALVDWYVEQFRRGAQAAYTHVGHHDLPRDASVRVRIAIHHAARWFKRTIMRIPTTRGSNYAVARGRTLELFEAGFIADEMQVGPAVKARGGRVVYGADSELTVLTSSRRIGGGWARIGRYVTKRLAYNLRVLPTRADAARHTGRRDLPRHATETNSTRRRGADQQ